MIGSLVRLVGSCLAVGYRAGRDTFFDTYVDLHDPQVSLSDELIADVQTMARQIGDIGERLGLGREWDPDECADLVQRAGSWLDITAEDEITALRRRHAGAGEAS